jgi:hypothetical protein
MKLKKIFKHYILRESIKEIEMNRILDKIFKKSKLSKKEVGFLNLYNETQAVEDDKDFMLISKNFVVKKVNDLIKIGKKVICDLHDRDGKIGIQILFIEDDINDESSIVRMKNDQFHKLHDKFLYNLIYNIKRNEYSLQEQDEFFEKIEVNDN